MSSKSNFRRTYFNFLTLTQNFLRFRPSSFAHSIAIFCSKTCLVMKNVTYCHFCQFQNIIYCKGLNLMLIFISRSLTTVLQKSVLESKTSFCVNCNTLQFIQNDRFHDRFQNFSLRLLPSNPRLFES